MLFKGLGRKKMPDAVVATLLLTRLFDWRTANPGDKFILKGQKSKPTQPEGAKNLFPICHFLTFLWPVSKVSYNERNIHQVRCYV
jgi:hypothetical protein